MGEGKIDTGGGRESDGERCIYTPTAVAPWLFVDVYGVSTVELSPEAWGQYWVTQWNVWVLLQHRSPEDHPSCPAQLTSPQTETLPGCVSTRLMGARISAMPDHLL